MLNPMRVAIKAEMIATKIRVEAFEILKQKSNSAMKKVTILSAEEAFHKCEPSTTSGEAKDDVRPHEQRPGKAENNGQRFKTEYSVRILIEIIRLHKCYLGTHIRCSCPLTVPAGPSFSQRLVRF
jgi:hypothetical protein